MISLRRLLSQAVQDSPEYRMACTHRSAGGNHNERLEFLGDAVLGLVISEYLHDRYSDLQEGDLTRLRAHLVCRTMLSALAREAGLGEELIRDMGQHLNARAQSTLEGNALEAVIAAVYQVSGIDAAREFILALYADRLQDLPAVDSLLNAKATLQELLQARGHPRPRYTLLAERPEHSPRFEVSCEVEVLELSAHGTGERIRQAECDAAAAVLSQMQQRWPDWTL